MVQPTVPGAPIAFLACGYADPETGRCRAVFAWLSAVGDIAPAVPRKAAGAVPRRQRQGRAPARPCEHTHRARARRDRRDVRGGALAGHRTPRRAGHPAGPERLPATIAPAFARTTGARGTPDEGVVPRRLRTRGAGARPGGAPLPALRRHRPGLCAHAASLTSPGPEVRDKDDTTWSRVHARLPEAPTTTHTHREPAGMSR